MATPVRAVKYSNDVIRCPKCGQPLFANQIVCPICKTYIEGYVRVHRKGNAAGYNYKGNGKKSKILKKLFYIAMLACIMLCLYDKYTKNDVNLHSLNEINSVNNFVPDFSPALSKHREKPVSSSEYVSKLGFEYEITQIFFKTDKSDEVEKEIYNLLNDCRIKYKNLYYTDEGYYTADLIGYGTYPTEQKYDEQVNMMQETIQNWQDKHPYNALALAGYEYHIQGWYSTI